MLSGQESFQPVEIELREDSLIEGVEVFRVNVELANIGLSGISFSSQSKDVVIRDNDRVFT